MVDNLRNMASYVYQMADNMEKEIRLNAFQTRLVAQQKQDKIRQLASLLIQKQDLPDQNDKENQPHISNIKNNNNNDIVNCENQKSFCKHFDQSKLESLLSDIAEQHVIINEENNKQILIPELEKYIQKETVSVQHKQALLNDRKE